MEVFVSQPGGGNVIMGQQQPWSKYRMGSTAVTLKQRLIRVSAVIGSLSILEHLLAQVTQFNYLQVCNKTENFAYEYFSRQFEPLFSNVTVSNRQRMEGFIAKVVFGRISLTIGTFLWTYADLFVIVISLGMTHQMKAFNRRLRQIKGFHLTEYEWEDYRLKYLTFGELCGMIDQTISSLALIAFSNDIFFICVQLLNSLRYCYWI